jgi:hypothetical protein
MNDTDGPWLTMETVRLIGLRGGRLRAVAKVKMTFSGTDMVTVTAAIEVDRDAAVRDVERALLEEARAALTRLGVPTLRVMETALLSCREETAIYEPLD